MMTLLVTFYTVLTTLYTKLALNANKTLFGFIDYRLFTCYYGRNSKSIVFFICQNSKFPWKLIVVFDLIGSTEPHEAATARYCSMKIKLK